MGSSHPESGGDERLPCPGDESRTVHRPGLSGDLAATPEQDQRRNRLNAVAPGNTLLSFGIDLQEPDMRLQLRSGRLERRRHGAARSAPARPEIDEDGQASPAHMPIEGGLIRLDGPPLEQRRTAPTALGRRTDPFERCPHLSGPSIKMWFNPEP